MNRGINWAGGEGVGEVARTSQVADSKGGKFSILNKTFDFLRSKNFKLLK